MWGRVLAPTLANSVTLGTSLRAQLPHLKMTMPCRAAWEAFQLDPRALPSAARNWTWGCVCLKSSPVIGQMARLGCH